MSAPSKPAGYTSLSPYLVVHGAQKVIDFLKQTFGATELRRYDNPTEPSCTRRYESTTRSS
jgi:PhnB protein